MEDDHLVYVERQVFVLNKGGYYFYSLSIKRQTPLFVHNLVPLLLWRVYGLGYIAIPPILSGSN